MLLLLKDPFYAPLPNEDYDRISIRSHEMIMTIIGNDYSSAAYHIMYCLFFHIVCQTYFDYNDVNEDYDDDDSNTDYDIECSA